jgi:DNA-binding response OmpR family regulator
LEFSVKDTGQGIPEETLEKIFDRFYQVESSLKKEGGGTGLGLSLSREMARLMHGDIKAESTEGKGSIFTVTIPLGIGHLNESEYVILSKIPEIIGYVPDTQIYTDEITDDRITALQGGKPLMLIVEDNVDIRSQLRVNFRNDYAVIEAEDGVAGHAKAVSVIPDIIITDLMMPRMGGIEMCDKIRNDERTSHIPVIMLTARASLGDKLEGYSSGADDYISKPFHVAELKIRASSLIEQRKRHRERYSREITLQPGDISITPLDERFLTRAIEVVEKHMKDMNFSIQVFRNEMYMAGSTLFRKLNALTGLSPAEFICTQRLKRAAGLIQKNYGNITQVSFEAGFRNLTTFNRSFRKFYGVSPAEYRKKCLIDS